MKRKLLFVNGARRWNSMIAKFSKLHRRIQNKLRNSSLSSKEHNRLSQKLKQLFAKLEKMQYRTGIKVAGSALAIMLSASSMQAQEFVLQTGDNNPFNGLSTSGSYSTPFFEDIDGDGDLDMYAGSSSSYLEVFINDGNNNFADPVNVQAGGVDITVPSYAAGTFEDIDGDGDLDLYLGHYGSGYNVLQVFENDGDGNFAAPVNLQADGVDITGGYYTTPIFADIDGDGDLDLYTEMTPYIAVYENDGDGNFSASGNLSADGTEIYGGYFSHLSFVDLDGDTDLDLYLSYSSGQINVYENDGDGLLSAAGNLQDKDGEINGGSYPVTTFEDLDDDGDYDMIMGTSTGAFKYYAYSPINAGVDQQLVGCNLEVNLSGNEPELSETGVWSIVSGGTGTFDDESLYNATFTADGAGTYVLKWEKGDLGDIVEVVIVGEAENPVITIPADISIDCASGAESTGVATATDNCDPDPDIAFSDVIVGNVITRTWIATDFSNNSVSGDQIITVSEEDMTAPEIVAPADATVECDDSTDPSELGFATSTDNCDADPIVTYVDVIVENVITRTWTATDAFNNSSNVEQTITIEDNTNPTLTCVGNQTINLLEGQTEYTVTGTDFDLISADDNCSSVGVQNDFNSDEVLLDAVFPLGTTTVTWTAMDESNNTETCSYEVEVLAFVGISDIVEAGISISPNPSNGIFKIETKSNFDVSISDISGKVVKQLTINSHIQTIDLSNQSSGIYFVKFTNDTTVKTAKIIIE